jgi:hypothetical protein
MVDLTTHTEEPPMVTHPDRTDEINAAYGLSGSMTVDRVSPLEWS